MTDTLSQRKETEICVMITGELIDLVYDEKITPSEIRFYEESTND